MLLYLIKVGNHKQIPAIGNASQVVEVILRTKYKLLYLLSNCDGVVMYKSWSCVLVVFVLVEHCLLLLGQWEKQGKAHTAQS